MLDVSKYFWIILIAVSLFNAYNLKAKIKKQIEIDPSLEEGYKSIFKAYILFMNIPWVIMGIGNLSGITSSCLDYFQPC